MNLFGHLDFGNSNLPFDLAQGGELVEPFRISDFRFIRVRFKKAFASTPLIKIMSDSIEIQKKRTLE
jgi:hypothetical protein